MPFGSRTADDALPPRIPGTRERPDYYVTPTHDFTQFTRDFEQKYWSRETAFDWGQSVSDNLNARLQCLAPEAFSRLAALVLPLAESAAVGSLEQIGRDGLPLHEDGLKAIRESVVESGTAIDRALAVQAPLERLRRPAAHLRERLAILTRERAELQEQRRLGLFKVEMTVSGPATVAQRQEQAAQLATLASRINETRQAVLQARADNAVERRRVKHEIREAFRAIAPEVVADLEVTRELVGQALRVGVGSMDAATVSQLRNLVLKRQLRGLKDIANHCIVVEQTAIAPLSVGIIHYKRRREIQEAMTTFVNDEAKHSAVFRRFLAEKMAAREHIPDDLIQGGDRYMWLARVLPSAGMYLAVIVETVGAACLEFFGLPENMPDPLFRIICKTIAEHDEARHMDLCAATYNELYRTGSRWERLRNDVALRLMLNAGYGKRDQQHPLREACTAFGLASDALYRHVASRLSSQLARVGTYISVEAILALMKYST